MEEKRRKRKKGVGVEIGKGRGVGIETIMTETEEEKETIEIEIGIDKETIEIKRKKSDLIKVEITKGVMNTDQPKQGRNKDKLKKCNQKFKKYHKKLSQ